MFFLPKPRAHAPRRQDDPRDDGPLADLTSGVMWLATAAIGVAVLVLPGTLRTHLGWAFALAGFAAGWGGMSLWLGIRAKTMPIGRRAAVTAAMMPIVALALWATGGVNSYLQPVLLFTALFLAYFFPPRLAWPLVALFVCAYATPLLYDPAALTSAYPARIATFAMAVAGEVVVMQFLKRRLLAAEARQRRMAEVDPLTGLLNRRSFDAALQDVFARGVGAGEAEGAALVLFDFDEFKLINDLHGHPAGDAVLRAVAEAAQRVMRRGDRLARIGGDEFAVLADGAGPDGVMRLIDALDQAIRSAHTPAAVGGVRATFAWATAPEEAADPEGLMQHADARLIARKRDRRAAHGTHDLVFGG
ncbi:MAG TPA: GGDEF domain-containing protein [Solirubrobacteraceae bacterium]|nr:GGDEF domain-containing protein [Solirubrobacteraceae bacterium]